MVVISKMKLETVELIIVIITKEAQEAIRETNLKEKDQTEEATQLKVSYPKGVATIIKIKTRLLACMPGR